MGYDELSGGGSPSEFRRLHQQERDENTGEGLISDVSECILSGF